VGRGPVCIPTVDRGNENKLAADQLEFEQAAELRDRIRALEDQHLIQA